VRFVGVAVRAMQSGASPAAPLIEVAGKPDDWRKQVKVAAAKQRNDCAEAFAEFWTPTGDGFRPGRRHRFRPDQRISVSNWLKLTSPIEGTVM
jgi:hypothetical protein